MAKQLFILFCFIFSNYCLSQEKWLGSSSEYSADLLVQSIGSDVVGKYPLQVVSLDTGVWHDLYVRNKATECCRWSNRHRYISFCVRNVSDLKDEAYLLDWKNRTTEMVYRSEGFIQSLFFDEDSSSLFVAEGKVDVVIPEKSSRWKYMMKRVHFPEKVVEQIGLISDILGAKYMFSQLMVNKILYDGTSDRLILHVIESARNARTVIADYKVREKQTRFHELNDIHQWLLGLAKDGTVLVYKAESPHIFSLGEDGQKLAYDIKIPLDMCVLSPDKTKVAFLSREERMINIVDLQTKVVKRVKMANFIRAMDW